MLDIRQIDIAGYDYMLPENQIARFPLEKRDESRLLIYRKGEIGETVFKSIPEYLLEGSLLVFNNTRVIQARLLFRKETGAEIEVFCLEPVEPADYAQMFTQTKCCIWQCLIGNAKRWKSGKLYGKAGEVPFTVERIANNGETSWVKFEWNIPEVPFAELLEKAGELPIPPYLNRKTEESDKTTYQTVYSKVSGSVAAPTAGLHFTADVLNEMENRRIGKEEITLHVGAGTFKPVKTGKIGEHKMHSECFIVKKSTVEKVLSHLNRVFAVGTTSVRTLESLYYLGLMIEQDPDLPLKNPEVPQWIPYEDEKETIPVEKSLHNLLGFFERTGTTCFNASTRILIAPGYTFRIISGIITNFHQPKSTLLLLISAFTGEDWKKIYEYALENRFRFLSYGDSSLLM